MAPQQTLLIVDFGSQYTQLIARRARELGVFSIIVPYRISAKKAAGYNPRGIIFSGGPNSVHGKEALSVDPKILELGVPVLGICYGLQLITVLCRGKVESSSSREYGLATAKLAGKSQLFGKKFDGSKIWMSHGDFVAKPPKGFAITATSEHIVCAVENRDKKLYGLQFHPEVTHTQNGVQILQNFLLKICGFSGNWRTKSVIKQQIEAIRQTVGKNTVVCALSGGVDSSVAATLVDRAIGAQQTCIFVDTGLLRKGEFEEVLGAYKKIGLNVKPVKAEEIFLSKLKGVVDPEKKRKIIGKQFIRVFEREAKKIKGAKYLVQGTLYPDVIESVSVNGPSVVIKSHHNVGGLPKKMHLKLIEPLRELFKDEVRQIGAKLGLPKTITGRQPFPGPGLAVRIIGEVNQENIALLQEADAIVKAEIDDHKDRSKLWQYFAVLLPIQSVGVMGDKRTYEKVIAIRAVESSDGMTANWAKLPHELLERISSRIVNEVKGINRVVYDITSKPPGTIEWE